MKEKTENQKGFIQIPLLIIIIASITVASAGTGVVLYKQGKLTPFIANISQVFRRTGKPATIAPKEVKPEASLGQPQIEQESEESQTEQELTEQELEEARLEAETAKAEAERLKKKAEQLKEEAEEVKRKAEAEKTAREEARIRTEQESRRQLEAQRLAEEQRQREIARQQEIERQRQLEEQRERELELQQAVNQIKSLFTQKLNEYNSQLNLLNGQILAKENEINLIIEEYDKKIQDNRNRPVPMSVMIGMEAKLIQERNEKLEPLYRELQSLENQYNRLIGGPIISTPYNYSISGNYWRFTPSGNGGILSDSFGNYYRVTYYPDGSFIIGSP